MRRTRSKKFLYRRLGLAVMGIVAWCGLGVGSSRAQMPQLKRPEEGPEEKPPAPKPKKLVNEPRAIAILQLNDKGKGTLIPVAIRIEGRFYDASVYKADPIPMALDGGTVYEVEKTGESEGLFTIRGALHNKNPDSSTPWLGSGTYVVNGAEVVSTVHRAEDKPRGLDNDTDAPPRLTRGKEPGSDQSSGAPTETSSKSGSGKASSENPGSTGGTATQGQGSGDSDDAPTLKRTASGSSPEQGSAKGDAGSGSGQGGGQGKTGASESTTPAAKDQTPPGTSTQGSSGQPAAGQSASGQGATGKGQGSPGFYRPTLRRGKPTESAPDDAENDAAMATDKLAAPGAAPSGAGATTAAPVLLVPAVSDAGGPIAQSYKFYWKEGEEDDRRKQMLELATKEIQAYLTALAKDTISARPATAKGGQKSGTQGHKTTQQVHPEFENVQFRAFDVWKNNQPVMILSAEAHLAQTRASAAALPAVYYVTIAARTDIYGDLRKLYSGVTDKFHLDVTPKLELIDAVDADGDGHGELLFRETTDGGTGYIIYRPTGDTLWKMFDSVKGG